jgi:ketosteroid isomerase-like protein
MSDISSKDSSALRTDSSHGKSLPNVSNVSGRKHRAQMGEVMDLFRHAVVLTPSQETEKINKLFSSDAKICFPGNPLGVPVPAFVGLMQTMKDSFPNWTFDFFDASYVEQGNTVTFDIRAWGNHTGKPYAFPPGLPAVEAKGTFVGNPIEKCTATLSNEGKVVKFVVSDPYDGSVGGPAGFYTRIGGKLPQTANYLPLLKQLHEVWGNPNAESQLRTFFAKDATMKFGDEPAMSVDMMLGMMKSVVGGAFSEFTLTFKPETLQENGHTVNFQRTVEFVHGKGPLDLTFLPGNPCPEIIPVTNKRIKLPTESVRIEFDGTEAKKITFVHVTCNESPLIGPVGAYALLGGKMNLSVGDQNVSKVKSMYAAFNRGDIQTVLNGLSEDAVYEWGDASDKHAQERHKLLPGYGRWEGRQGFLASIQEYTGAVDIVKMVPAQWFTSKSGNEIVVVIENVSVSKTNPQKSEYSEIAHRFVFNEAGQVTKLKEYSDTLLFANLLAK